MMECLAEILWQAQRDNAMPDIEAYAPWDTFYFDTDPSIAVALVLLEHQ